MQKSEVKQTQGNKLAPIDRFTNSIVACYGDTANGMEITERERDIIKGYFMAIDLSLRNSKDGYNWGMVKMEELAPRLKHYARLGLDMQLPNHLSAVPYKAGNSGKINLTLIPGYEGKKYIAKRFAVVPYEDMIVKLVGKNDTFKAIYRDANHEYDNFVFEENSFDKGEIIGGFAYVTYSNPKLNKLTVMPLAEIKKHMPKHGSSFWTGDWKEQMWKKTLVIVACKDIALDPEKIRDYKQDFDQIKADELNDVTSKANAEAEEKTGTGDFVDVDYHEVEEAQEQEPDGIKFDQETGEIFDDPENKA